MLRIRLLRIGKKNQPHFRMVVTLRSSAPKSGGFLEILGSYNPIKHQVNLKKERIQHWISKGAQPSDTAKNMLITAGILEGRKVQAHKKSKKPVESKVLTGK